MKKGKFESLLILWNWLNLTTNLWNLWKFWILASGYFLFWVPFCCKRFQGFSIWRVLINAPNVFDKMCMCLISCLAFELLLRMAGFCYFHLILIIHVRFVVMIQSFQRGFNLLWTMLQTLCLQMGFWFEFMFFHEIFCGFCWNWNLRCSNWWYHHIICYIFITKFWFCYDYLDDFEVWYILYLFPLEYEGQLRYF